MRKIFITLSVAIQLLMPFAISLAGELKTVTLSVDGMTCNMCPITVKKALQKVDGVKEVVAKYEGNNNGWTRVIYDTSKASVEDLTFATEEAGYPSRLKQ